MEYLKLVTGMFITHIPVSRHRPAIDGSAVGPHPGVVSRAASLERSYQERQAARDRGRYAKNVFRVCPMCRPSLRLGFKNFETSQWYGILTPAGTPPDVVKRMQEESLKALKSSAVTARFATDNAVGGGGPSSEFASFIASRAEDLERHRQARRDQGRLTFASTATFQCFDVLVIGGGNAALCAALMAREAGASVLVLESAPREWRGGNSSHTRNLRCMHDAPQDVLTEVVHRRRILAGPAEGHRRANQRTTGAAGDPAFIRLPRLDAPAWRALSAVAVWHAAPVADQRILSWAAARRW